MISVVVSAGDGLLRALYRVLAREFEVLCVTGQEILHPDMPPQLLLLGAKAPLECDGDVIYVLGAREVQEPARFEAGPRAVAVVGSQSAGALQFVARHHLKTLTCGLSSRDTLTLSSIAGESAVICLQREIATLGGALLEPADFPVRLVSPMDRFDLLAAAAVLLLCGGAERLEEPI